MNNIHITKINTADLHQLYDISHKTYFETFKEYNSEADMNAYLSESFNLEQLTKELKNSDSHFYFAYINNELAGYLKLNDNDAQTEFQDSHGTELQRIYVLPQFQGQKVGNALLKFALEQARAKEKKYICLGVWEKNYKAQAFYINKGFQEIGSHPFVMGEDVQIDLLLRKEL